MVQRLQKFQHIFSGLRKTAWSSSSNKKDCSVSVSKEMPEGLKKRWSDMAAGSTYGRQTAGDPAKAAAYTDRRSAISFMLNKCYVRAFPDTR